MKHIPRSSRIFIGLLVISLLLTYVALHFATYVADFSLRNAPPLKDKSQKQEVIKENPIVKLETTDWKQYQDKAYPLAFLYPENWTIKSSMNKMGFYDIVLNPGTKFPDMHIYISEDGYFGLGGLEKTPIKIGGQEGFSVAQSLVGIKTGEYYYTFDGSTNTTQINEFYTLLDTVKFDQTLE